MIHPLHNEHVIRKNSLSTKEWMERIVLDVVFLGTGSLIMLLFSPYRLYFANKATDYTGRTILIALLLAAVIISHLSTHLEKYQPILTGLFIFAVAVTASRVFGVYLQNSVNVSDAVPAGWAKIKLNEAVVVIGSVIFLTKAFGGSLGSIYIQKGKWKNSLTIGLVTFLLAVVGSFPMAALFKAQDLTIARVLPWIPWILIYVLCNGALEEILFRGLFLRKLQPFFGLFLSNFLVALVFTGLHNGATYSADNLIFLSVTFPLALAWGYLMQKTDSVIGSILFHAGMDIPIMLGIFSNL